MARTFESFLEAVRASVDEHAKRKNYTDNGVLGENKLAEVGRLLEFEPQHGIGEIVYKCAEYLRNPREVLLEKIAGWAGILWMRHAEEAPVEPYGAYSAKYTGVNKAVNDIPPDQKYRVVHDNY